MLEGLITTMRIISGKARGTKLYTLEGINTRPTLDRVKESLFNILQNEIQNSIFLDVFAGSGAIGLEAASRGAKKVYMCENSRSAVQIIQKNIDKTHLKEQVVLYDEDYEKVRNMYIRAAKEIGDVPLTVANDGDVTALAGALSLKDGRVLGIAMGTSEAVGYVNKDGNLNGWLSELAFVPVDYNKGAMVDEWSGDYGCGVKYL